MKTFYRISLIIVVIFALTTGYTLAQRVIKGTVYKEGKPAAGITVEAHRGGTMMTSFDGKYEVAADAKSKYLKFTFIEDSKRLSIEDNSSNEIDFYFDDKKPENGDGKNESSGVNLKSKDELLQERNEEYINNYSLYDQYFKQDDYNSALPHWKILYNQFPKSHINIYIQGIRMYDALMEKAKTAEEKDKLFKESLNIYDKRIKNFGQKGKVLGMKGFAYLQYYLTSEKMPEGNELKEIWKNGYNWVNESAIELGNETEPPVLLLLMQTSSSLFKIGELPKAKVVENYEKCIGILNTIITQNKDKANVDLAKDVLKYVEDSFAKSGAADCETLVSFLTPQFKEKGNDIEFIKSMLRRLSKAKCTESDLYAQATEKFYELDPSAEAAYNMARRYVNRNEIDKAKEYYKMAIDQESDKNLLSDYYLELATTLFVKDNNLIEARNTAKKAIDNNPKNCEAYMLIGTIYGQASRNYGADAFEKRTVFWVAVDYFERARSAGEDCAVDASQKAAEYRRQFPSKEEGFYREMKDGQSYHVGGWINETTRVRY